MKLTNKNIRRIGFWSPFIFSIILSLFLSIGFEIHYYNITYWLITVPAQIYYLHLNNKFIDIMYKVKEKRRLRFKEFVKDV